MENRLQRVISATFVEMLCCVLVFGLGCADFSRFKRAKDAGSTTHAGKMHIDGGTDAEPPNADAGPPRALHPREGAPAPEALDAGDPRSMDAGTTDSAPRRNPDSGPLTPSSNFAIGELDMACIHDHEAACTGPNSRQKTVCAAGKWTPNGSCDGNYRCDTEIGPTQGTCSEHVNAFETVVMRNLCCDCGREQRTA